MITSELTPPERPFLAGDIVLHGTGMDGQPKRWRVKRYLQRIGDPAYNSELDAETAEFLQEWVEEEKAERRSKGLPATRRYTLQTCPPEEATHLSLTGVCGAIVPVGECEYAALVEWPAHHIREAREKAAAYGRARTQLYGVWYWE